MQQFDYVIRDRDGVHARPAGRLIQFARNLKPDITLVYHQQTVNLKGGIFALMCLGIRFNDTITIQISGEEESQAAAALQEMLVNIL